MEIKINRLAMVALVYMYLAVVIFFIGWLQPVYALAACLVLCAGLFWGIRSWCGEQSGVLFLSKRVLFAGALLILFLCWHTGIGAFTGQAGDWVKHNAVLHDLIEREWPVIYQTAYGDSMLSYYIGFYLFPAVIGKIFDSFRAAELCQFAMTAAGIFLLWLLVIKIGKVKGEKGQLLCLVLLFLFGGLLPLGQTVAGSVYPENFFYGSHDWMNPETVVIQYTSNWSLLKWVPGQAVVPWLATVLLLLKPHKTENYVLIGLPVILYSGFAMVGLAAMMLAMYLYDMASGGWKQTGKDFGMGFVKAAYKAFIRAFSLSNILLAAAGGILVLYFWGNISGEKPEYLKLHWLNYGQKPGFYFIFCFFMFGFYAILLWKDYRRNVLYWITIAGLLVYPRFSMGLYNDFTMRASIPALFTLLILILQFLGKEEGIGKEDGEEDRRRNLTVRKTLMAAGLAIGMIYPLLNIRVSITKNIIGEIYRTDGYMTLEVVADPSNGEIPDDFKYNYYSYDLEHDLFYQYLAK